MAEQPRDDSDHPVGFTALTAVRDGVTVVSLTGELDMLTVARAETAVERAVGDGLPVVLDLTGLTFFSSAGLTLLAQVHEQRSRRPVDVRLVADQRVVLLPLELAGMRDLFPVHTSLPDALGAAR